MSCLNMVQFGGTGCRKQACEKRRCRQCIRPTIQETGEKDPEDEDELEDQKGVR